MASKKFLLLVGIFALISFATKVNAQSSGVYTLTSYDYTDSSLIPESRMDQQNDFMNNRYLYPAKPRNQWEVGLSVGGLNVSGDVRSKSIFNGALKPLETLGFGVHVRKAWGYVISTRLQYIHGSASGYNYQRSTGYTDHLNTAWRKAGYTGEAVYYNYCSQIRNLSLDLIASLNNAKFHRSSSKTSIYGLFGVGATFYRTFVDALDAGGNRYTVGTTTFQSIDAAHNNGHTFEDRKSINSSLKSLFDGNYETQAERHSNRGWLAKNSPDGPYTFRPTANTGLGIQFRLGKSVSLGIEDKVIFTMDDLVDGQRWQEWSTPGNGGSSMTRDYDNINYLSVSLGVNLGGNAVAPLWWVNPYDFLYNSAAQKTQKYVAKCDGDADGDGVSDCYDRCGDTPGGVAVDTHGCPLDTDGDGVADYKDKQLITPTECQPSDADGIGKCPCPDGCQSGPVSECGSIGAGSIMFSGGSRSLSSSAMNQLNNLANAMRSNPNCKVVIMGNGANTKVQQQRSWDRVNAVINYMVDRNGIDRGRFIFQYGLNGDPNTVDYRSAGDGESGPSNTPPPFPNLKRD